MLGVAMVGIEPRHIMGSIIYESFFLGNYMNHFLGWASKHVQVVNCDASIFLLSIGKHSVKVDASSGERKMKPCFFTTLRVLINTHGLMVQG